MIARPQTDDRIGGKVQIDNYKGSGREFENWKLTKVLDDILLVKYTDISEDGKEIKRGSIWLPIDAVNHVWRIGQVILVGPNVKVVEVGDHVVFPNDKGLQVAEINGMKNVVFLNESRIFGVATPLE